MLVFAFFIIAQASGAEQPAAAPSSSVEVQKKIIYQKETTVDLSGSNVDGEGQVPPTFFVTKMQTPKGASLLEERLKFGLRNFNDLGF